MHPAVPGTAGELIERGDEFRARLQGLKQRLAVPDYVWYPYNSLATLEVITGLLEPVFGAVVPARSGPIADIACGDGDLGLFWAHLGGTVDAVDHRESNFNQMRGVTILRDALGLPMEIHDLDLDREFSLPRSEYHLAFFLGTLYHLKNPGLALEILARQCDWCILSTRIAQVTPRGVEIEEEPLAYLLGAREANNDPTNYWIFSATGLFRLLDRAGWIVVGHERLGQTWESDPVKPEADERIFVLVKSKLRHPELVFRPLYGWFEPEQDAWRWTAKRFGLEVIPPENPSLPNLRSAWRSLHRSSAATIQCG